MTEKQNLPVEIIRSPNRSKTASARMVEGRLVVRVPAGISVEEEQRLIDTLMPRVLKKVARRTSGGLPDLRFRSGDLNRQYFGGKLKVREIKWVSNQNKRYGSCTPATATIRISDRVASMPPWVLDYVLVHELAHLVEANHSPAFWRLVARYPLTERARGYLIAVGMEAEAGPGEEELTDA
ncbi:MAG: YgjP-like metallopeptidase domain-containing protein [Chloroflexia bacterium]